MDAEERDPRSDPPPSRAPRADEPAPDAPRADEPPAGADGHGAAPDKFLTCSECGAVIAEEYHLVDGAVACDSCRAEFEVETRGPLGFVTLLRSAALGLLAAAAGVGIYYLAIQVTGYRIAALALLTGFFVGLGVRMGANARGGWPLQLLAMVLTYSVVVVTHLPDMLQQRSESTSDVPRVAPRTTAAPGAGQIPSLDTARTPAASPQPPDDRGAERVGILGSLAGLLASVGLVLAAPIGAGGENIFALSLVLAGLYVAWAMNRRRRIDIQGPFPVRANGQSSHPGPPAE